MVQCANFSEPLRQSLARDRNWAIETAQVIEELVDMAKKFQAAARRGESLGLNHGDEMAFYVQTSAPCVRCYGNESA